MSATVNSTDNVNKPKSRQPRTHADVMAMLKDPNRAAVTVSEAAQILGIAKSTAHVAYKSTGYLSVGVPVMRIGKRVVVSVFHLRAALGMPEPTADSQ